MEQSNFIMIRKKETKKDQKISTASLPDIVFMLLFFFMVSTVMRDTSILVKQSLPTATEVNKLERKSLVSYIYVGPPSDKRIVAKLGDKPRIQLNDKFASVDEIHQFILLEREQRNEKEVPLMTTSLRVHKETKMGMVTDIKQALRDVDALKINYSTKKGVKK